MIELITDSTSDLSPELLERYHIKRVPLSVFVDGKDLKDGDLTLAQLFDAVERTGELPKTSAVPVAEFQQLLVLQTTLSTSVYPANSPPHIKMPF